MKSFPLLFAVLLSVPFRLAAQVVHTAVTFTTTDTALQKLYHVAIRKCTWNIQQFGRYKVLVEGAGYQPGRQNKLVAFKATEFVAPY